MHHPKAAASKSGIAAAFFLRRSLEQRNTRTLLGSGERCAQSGIASSDDDNIKSAILHLSASACAESMSRL
jgi:hypothetical protein